MGVREEDKFRDQETKLRGSDLELQNSMIKFSQFLQENEKKKTEADLKRSEENKVRFITRNNRINCATTVEILI